MVRLRHAAIPLGLPVSTPPRRDFGTANFDTANPS